MADNSKIHHVATAGNNLTIGGNFKAGCTEIIYNVVSQTAAASLCSSSPSFCCKMLKNNELSCDVLQQKLREFYKNMVLSKIAWLEEEREFLIQDYFIDLKLTKRDKPIEIEDTFNKLNEGKKPLRIYIQGQPGYGKTTLANKLVNDWALQKEYIKHFKLVFLLPLHEQDGRSIQEIITSIGQHLCLEENQNAIDIVNNHKNQTLFILDELDEVSEERSSILKTLYKLEYSEVTIIVFSKTGLFSLTKDEQKDLFKGVNKSSDFSDMNISILGINSREMKKMFLNKFLPTQDVDEILDDLESNLELFNSPLFLMLLTIIVSEKETIIGPFRNRTEIYKMLFNYITRHHLIKDIDSEFDLFQCNSEINETQSLSQQFGKLSLENIKKNELPFESNCSRTSITQTSISKNFQYLKFFQKFLRQDRIL